MPAAELLMWISQFQKTGTLEIRTSTWNETMAFDIGALVFSSSSNRERTLGRLLIKYGIVTEEGHKRARELSSNWSASSEKKPRGSFTTSSIRRMESSPSPRAICRPLDLLPMRVDVSKMLLRVTQHKDEKGKYDFDSTGIHLESPTDI